MSAPHADGLELEHLTVPAIYAYLGDWRRVLVEENGDLTPSSWAQIDALLDELGRRLEAKP